MVSSRKKVTWPGLRPSAIFENQFSSPEIDWQRRGEMRSRDSKMRTSASPGPLQAPYMKAEKKNEKAGIIIRRKEEAVARRDSPRPSGLYGSARMRRVRRARRRKLRSITIPFPMGKRLPSVTMVSNIIISCFVLCVKENAFSDPKMRIQCQICNYQAAQLAKRLAAELTQWFSTSDCGLEKNTSPQGRLLRSR